MQKVIQDGRMKHMHGVAEYMRNNAEKYGLNLYCMYIVGLLHDIGYINGKASHEENGANMLLSLKVLEKYCDIIRFHGKTPEEYKAIFRCSDDEIPKELILLWEADMHVDQSGEDVGYEARLTDIGNRLGFLSEAYRICDETINWLKSNGIG